MTDRHVAEDVALALDLDPLRGVACPACLFGVACALEDGDESEIRKSVRLFAPLLWTEGLGEALEDALRRARAARVPGADAASADVAARGGRAAVTDAVVRRLAAGSSRRWSEGGG